MSGIGITIIHTHTVDCFEDCPLDEGENVGEGFE